MKNKAKNIALFAISIIAFSSCDLDPAHRNIRKYIEEHVTDPSVIANIEYGEPDSVLTDIRLGFNLNMILRASTEYNYDAITLDSLEVRINDGINDIENIKSSVVDRPNIKELKTNPKYNDEWRAVYPVTITYKDGHSNNFEILMDNDGVTPRMTTEEYLLKLEQDKLEIQAIESRATY